MLRLANSGIQKEIALVLELAAPLPDEKLVRSLLAADQAHSQDEVVDWNLVEAFAGKHQLLTFLYPRLTEFAAGQIPPVTLDRFHRAYWLNIQRSVRFASRLLDVQSILHDAGVEIAALRGPALMENLYQNPGFRVFNDLDILLHPDDFPACYHSLCQAGWQPSLDLLSKEQRWITRGDRDLVFAREKVVLEVHWAVDERGYSFPLDAEFFLEGTVVVDLLDSKVNVLEPSKAFLMMCLHGVRHQWEKLIWAVDLSWFVHAHPQMDWHAYWDLACSLGFRRVTAMSILAAEATTGAQFPQAVLLAARSDRTASSQVSVALDRQLARDGKFTNSGYRRALFELRYNISARERLSAKFFLVADRLFTPRQSDWRWLTLPTWLYSIYYLLRPLRLILDVLRTGFKQI